jgi:RIO-like serine/threonine protein kinase
MKFPIYQSIDQIERLPLIGEGNNAYIYQQNDQNILKLNKFMDDEKYLKSLKEFNNMMKIKKKLPKLDIIPKPITFNKKLGFIRMENLKYQNYNTLFDIINELRQNIIKNKKILKIKSQDFKKTFELQNNINILKFQIKTIISNLIKNLIKMIKKNIYHMDLSHINIMVQENTFKIKFIDLCEIDFKILYLEQFKDYFKIFIKMIESLHIFNLSNIQTIISTIINKKTLIEAFKQFQENLDFCI